MKVLITGANGFIGKNLISTLNALNGIEIYKYDIDTDPALLNEYTAGCDFVFHLAGVNRPEHTEDYMKGNFGFTSVLLDLLHSANNKAPVLITSSIQANLDNPYGQSKKAGEDLIFKYGKDNDVAVYVYRLPNVFGKWSRPNYNSAVATFCYNIARDIPITMNDPDHLMQLVYIDDVISEFINACRGMAHKNREDHYCYIKPVYEVKLGYIAKLLESFKASRKDLTIPDMSDPFIKKLYASYLSYLPEDQFSYPLKMNMDERGSFTEILRTADRGQFSVNIAKPGITKGNHWHHTKNEKFLVVSGRGIIRFRKPDDHKIIEYHVSGDKLEIVDIPTGYTHNIENTGDTDLITFMWCNECFDPDKPDTYFLGV